MLFCYTIQAKQQKAFTMIVCRFAPSPTGFLHIGNLRTAIFNYLYARHNNGKFLLRIEDTDKERSTQEAVDVILSGLSLMGIDYDEEIVYQSQNINRHTEVALKLLESGKAYKCFHTPEELESIRKANKNKVRSRWRDVPEEEHPDSPYVVRIRAPQEGYSEINDLVQGQVKVKNSELDDMIILRSDGSPVYQLAVVVDDHDAGVNTVIRGDDHLTNTYRQMMIYNAMGWDIPTYGHLPLIMNPSGKKMSKRDGAASVVDFINMGYLPSGLLNYLSKLGWSNEEEFLSKEDLISKFDFDHVGSSASRLDMKKLNFINAHWIQNTDNKTLTDSYMNIANIRNVNVGRELIESIMDSLKVRTKTIVEMVDMTQFLDESWFNSQNRDSDFDHAIISTHIEKIVQLRENNDILMEYLKSISLESNVSLKSLAAYIRLRLCASKISPPLDVIMNVLGEEESINRLKKET